MKYKFEEVHTMSFHEKLAEVHAAIKQPVKDSLNPHFNSSFASLNECNRVVRDAVMQVGDCDYWQRAVFNPDAKCWEMQTLFQADGQAQVLSSHPFRDDANPQKAASASTYARRYSLLSAFNLAAEDDDGNQASRPPDTASGTEAAKQRMWHAVKAYAAKTGQNPNDIIAHMQQDTNVPWQESSDYFEMQAMKFEDLANG